MTYKKSYGAWAGDPRGQTPDRSRCCEEVWSSERFSRAHQCSNKRGHGPNGDYCKKHVPDAVSARRAAAESRQKAKWNNLRYEFHGREFFSTLVKIAEGHNDPRGLAQSVIDVFQEG